MTDANENPYAVPPGYASDPTAGPLKLADLRSLLQKFRRQMHGLGAFWILLGCLRVVAIIIEMRDGGRLPAMDEPSFIVSLLPLLMLPLGIATCLKLMAGVRLGLWLFLALLLAALPRIGFGELLILGIIAIFVLRQAVALMAMARQLSLAGIPLNAHPDILTNRSVQSPQNK